MSFLDKGEPALAVPLLDAEQTEQLLQTTGFEAFSGFMAGFVGELENRPAIIAEQWMLGDHAAARASAHYLKGPALTIGAARIAALCESIERGDEARSQRLIGLLQEAAEETGRAVRALIAL